MERAGCIVDAASQVPLLLANQNTRSSVATATVTRADMLPSTDQIHGPCKMSEAEKTATVRPRRAESAADNDLSNYSTDQVRSKQNTN